MKSIFISGAANGIGKAVAQKFLHEGWLVGAYDIAEVTYTHPNLRTGHLDVREASSWDSALADFASHTGGTIDVVDNNAGIIIQGPLAEASEGDVDKLLSINVLGVTLGARAAHPYLARTPGAHFINMASASAVYGQPNIATYSASKFYVGGLTEALNLEWRKDDIRVVDIWPLWAKTALSKDMNVKSVKVFGVRITPEQVAETVWNTANPKSRWARGKVHHGVSFLDKAFYVLKSLLPDRVTKLIAQVAVG